tara:strand:+ start:2482 stop:3165 length:684 start_codon:yes stop_codon:yes gene_type:complete
MPTINPGNDGIFKVDNAASWDAARDATSATVSTTANHVLKIATATGPYDIYRSMQAYDTSGISITPASATLKMRGSGFNVNNNIIIMKVNAGATGASGAAFVDGDFDQIDWSTAYSAEITINTTTWQRNVFNSITLNSTALSDMRSLSEFKLAIVTITDYNDDGTAASTKSGPGWNSLANTNASRRPYIDYTEGTAGYGNNVNGVASANIGKVDGVATADIEKINGV